MTLTPAQLATLKANILATPAVSGLPNSTDGNFAVSDYYNALSNPAFIVWRSTVTTTEIMSNGFLWNTVDGMTVGKARIWDWMSQQGSINPSKANVRQGLIDAFGSGTPMANGITPHLKRTATRAEALFATGTGTDAAPGTMDFEGRLSFQEVEAARNS